MREADRLHPERAGRPEVLDRHVRLGAVRRDPGDRGAHLVRLVQVVDGAEAGEHEDGDLGLGGLLDGGLDELELVDLGEAVVEARPAEAVAVRHLDDLDAGLVEGVDDAADLRLGVLVAHRVRAVAQGRVGDPQVALAAPAGGVASTSVSVTGVVTTGHPRVGWSCHPWRIRLLPSRRRRRPGRDAPEVGRGLPGRGHPSRCATMMSPTRAAAAVMMSRLPA